MSKTVVLCNLLLLSDSASFWPSADVAVMTSFQYSMSQQTEKKICIKRENLCHDHVLITVNILIIKRK